MPWVQIAIAVKKEDIWRNCDFLVRLEKQRYFPKCQTARYVRHIDLICVAGCLKHFGSMIVNHHNTADGVLLPVRFLPVRQINACHRLNLCRIDCIFYMKLCTQSDLFIDIILLCHLVIPFRAQQCAHLVLTHGETIRHHYNKNAWKIQ